MKTIRSFCILFVLLTGIFTSGYAKDPFLLDSLHTSRIRLNAGYSFASDAITNKIAQTYFLAGFISDEMKDDVSKQLFQTNRFGGNAGYSLDFRSKINSFFGKAGYSWFADISDQNHLHSSFTRDAFELYFRGNAAYSGKQANLGPFDFSLIHYQQFELGLQKEFRSGKNLIQCELGLSYNKGQKFQFIHSDRAELYTSADGEYLDIDFDIALRGSDSVHNDPGRFNGNGGSVDFALNIISEQKNELSFRVHSFGFILFNNQSYIVPADSNFRFEGIDASSLFNFSDTISTPVSSDSSFVQSFLSNRKKENYFYKLPAQISVSYRRQMPDEITNITFGLDHTFFSSYLPHGWFRAERIIHKQHQAGLIFGYGGYTLWQAGLSYSLNFCKSWIFTIESPVLSGWLNSKSGRAQGAFVSLSKYL